MAMKELSIEQKAKAYDEALIKAKEALDSLGDNYVCNHLTKDDIREMYANLFPQLKESYSERIRKAIIEHFADSHSSMYPYKGFTKKEILDWFEKQGEQKPADKIEPRFKAGDWIVFNGLTLYVKVVANGFYLTTSRDGITNSYDCSIDNVTRLWTIQDAKDGDALCYKDEISLYKHDIKNCTKQETTFGGFVYHCCYDGKRFIMDGLYSLTEQDKMDIHPATKEQRDTLMKLINDVGYTFDFEKKELKKIGQKPAEWHREDEQNLNACLGYIPDEFLRRWLKDIIHAKYDKPAEWKPNDEQITWLYRAADDASKDSRMKQVLNNLLSDLKKLREK